MGRPMRPGVPRSPGTSPRLEKTESTPSSTRCMTRTSGSVPSSTRSSVLKASRYSAPLASTQSQRVCRAIHPDGPHRVSRRLFIVNEGHLASVLETYVEHYNGERPHRGCGLVPPDGGKMVTPLTALDSVKRRDRLGGLIHEYHRTAA